MTEVTGDPVAPDSSDSGESIATPETQATTEAKRKLKVKVDGEEVEVDEDEITRDYQKYKASDKRFQEAAALRKQAERERAEVETLLRRAAEGDLSWIKQIAPEDKVRSWAEKELLEVIEWEQLPDAEKRAIAAERKAKELESRVNEITQIKEREQASVLEEKAFQEIDAQIVEALQEFSYTKSKVSLPRFIMRIAEQMYASLDEPSNPDAPTAPLTAKDARDRAWKGYVADAREVISLLPPDEAIALIPDSLRKAIRMADVSAAQGQLSPKSRVTDYSEKEAPVKRDKKLRGSTDDVFKELAKRFSNK